MSEEFLTLREVCESFHISQITLWRWRRAGLKSYKISGKVFFKPEDLKSWIEKHERG